MMTIAEVSEKLGLTHRALRFYEARGLVKPRRLGRSGARSYDPKAVEALRKVQRLTRYGFTLTDIRIGVERKQLIERLLTLREEAKRLPETIRLIEMDIDAMEDGSYG